MDIVLEDPKGRLAGIEVKTAAVIGSENFEGLRVLGEAGGKHFHRGKDFLYLIVQKIINSSWSAQILGI